MNLDPTEPLEDHFGQGRMFIIEEPRLSCVCEGTGWIENEWTLRREALCTCGAGSPEDINILHAMACDSVPCPLCPLEASCTS